MNDPQFDIRVGNCLDLLKDLEPGSVAMGVTSIPYWGLRDYGTPIVDWPAVTFRPSFGFPEVTVPAMTSHLGLEPDVVSFIGHIVLIFRAMRPKLHPLGTSWVNCGDVYASARSSKVRKDFGTDQKAMAQSFTTARGGYKPKQLIGQSWLVALALQADGWWLRREVIWHKTNAKHDPGSHQRPGSEHEYLFMLTPGPDAYYDQDAVRIITGREATWDEYNAAKAERGDWNDPGPGGRLDDGHQKRGPGLTHPLGKARRTVWPVAVGGGREPDFGFRHTATFPLEIPRICVAASSRPGDLVLDIFSGMATSGIEACSAGRRYLGMELHPEAAAASIRRMKYHLQTPEGMAARAEDIAERKRAKQAEEFAKKQLPGQGLLGL